MRFSIGVASGRSKCKMCGKNISSRSPQLVAQGGSGVYSQRGTAHIDCILELISGEI
jgi:hypothetical protein